jgi:hypothetical protein
MVLIVYRVREAPTTGGKLASRWIRRQFCPWRRSRFEIRPIRYLQLTFRNCRNPVRVRSVGARMINYPFQDRGSFQCSDPLLTRIWGMGQYTIKACTYDAFVDCPWGEKGNGRRWSLR